MDYGPNDQPSELSMENEIVSTNNNTSEESKKSLKEEKLVDHERMSESKNEGNDEMINNRSDEINQLNQENAVYEDERTDLTDSTDECEQNSQIIHRILHINDNEPFKVKVKLNNKIVIAIIDTGSKSCLVSSSVCESLNIPVDFQSKSIQVVADNDKCLTGKATCSLELGNACFSDKTFDVFSSKINPSVSLILGSVFFKRHDFEVNLSKNLLIRHRINGGQIEYYFDTEGNLLNTIIVACPVYASRNYSFPPGAVYPMDVECKVPNTNANLLYTSGDFGDESRGVDGIYDSESKMVFFTNCADKEIKIKKGEKVGTLSTMVELGSENEGNNESLDNIDVANIVELPELSVEDAGAVIKMLNSEDIKPVFSAGEHDVGLARVGEHKINLHSESPIYQRPRRFPPPIAKEIDKHCKFLESLDIIEKSQSEFSSPVVPVRKADGGFRMCIDYRLLNRATVADKFPLPNLVDSVFGLHGSLYFTTLDLVKAYHQLPIAAESRKYTAFSTPSQQWQYKRLPFGLKNAPSAFQREINTVLSSFPSNKVSAYLDDIMIIAKSFDEHLDLVCKVLRTLAQYGMKINAEKCKWFRSEVRYLGHIVGREGIRKTPEYIKEIAEYPLPRTVGELRAFLGLINFQRKFLRDCSQIQKPLSSQLSGEGTKRSSKRVLIWTEDMHKAFETLKTEMCRDVKLSYPEYGEGAEKLELWVDACGGGAGAYLAQSQQGCHRVLGFASMTFSDAEKRYSVMERELAALRWGVKTFRPFLLGCDFNIFTDHEALVHLNNMKMINNRIARTIQELSEYSYRIMHVPGKLNIAADILSRLNVESSLSIPVAGPELPDGLIVNGKPAPGGGDSMFISLYRNLSDLKVDNLPSSVDELRVQLVNEILKKPETYNVKLNKEKRNILRSVTIPGVTPVLELLHVASKLYSVSIHVYFSALNPIVYTYDSSYKNIINLQCCGGVHFNPLVETRNFVQPSDKKCCIYSINSRESEISPKLESNLPLLSNSGDDEEETDDDEQLLLLNFDRVCICEHGISAQPMIRVQVPGTYEKCAMLDIGSDISLVAETALSNIVEGGSKCQIENIRQVRISGFSGGMIVVDKTCKLEVNMGNKKIYFNFYVAPDTTVPCCFLLGRDLIKMYKLSIDFYHSTVKCNNEVVASILQADPAGFNRVWFRRHFLNCDSDSSGGDSLRSVESSEASSSVLFLQADRNVSHKLKIDCQGSDYRFELMGGSSGVTGLALLVDDKTIGKLQSNCPDLRALKRSVINSVPVKNWDKSLTRYKRFSKKIEIINDTLTHSKVIIVPFKILVQVALAVHHEFAHVGRDKLLNLLSDLVWHPSLNKVVTDLTRTCHNCQVNKIHARTEIPPTHKIQTSKPFELCAIDLMSLPPTASGFVACLSVVDHYSKWSAVVPLRSKTSKAVINALNNVVFPLMLGLPENVLSDNGSEFISYEMEEFLESNGIKHRFITPLVPQANGAVERVNRTFQGLLRGLVDNPSDWDKRLPRALLVYNTTLHSEIGMSPREFLLSRVHESDRAKITPHMNLTWRAGHPNFSPFKVGELVLKKKPLKGHSNINKFEQMYTGPYKISKVSQKGVSYEIHDQLTDQTLRAHHSQLYVYFTVPFYISNNAYFKNYVSNEPLNENVSSPSALPMSDLTACNFESGSSSSAFSASELEIETVSDSEVESRCVGSDRLSPAEDKISGIDKVSPIKLTFDKELHSCGGCIFESSRIESLSRRSVDSLPSSCFGIKDAVNPPLQSTTNVDSKVEPNLPIGDDWLFSSIDVTLDQTICESDHDLLGDAIIENTDETLDDYGLPNLFYETETFVESLPNSSAGPGSPTGFPRIYRSIRSLLENDSGGGLALFGGFRPSSPSTESCVQSLSKPKKSIARRIKSNDITEKSVYLTPIASKVSVISRPMTRQYVKSLKVLGDKKLELIKNNLPI